jgi:hypothetical protein
MRIFFVGIIQFIVLFSNAKENYIEYYHRINFTEKLFVENELEHAFEIYYQAFELNFPFIQDIDNFLNLSNNSLLSLDSLKGVKISKIMLLKENFFSGGTQNYVKQLISRSHTSDSIKTILINSFNYITEEDFFIPQNDVIELLNLLNNMFYADQFVRRLHLNNDECKDSILLKADKKNRDRLISLILENGFPSRKISGNQNIHFLLLHVSPYMEMVTIESILVPEISKGNYHPSQFARLVDRYRTWVLEEPQIYGEWIGADRVIGDVEQLEKIDEIRSRIFLNTLYVYSRMNNYILPENYIEK